MLVKIVLAIAIIDNSNTCIILISWPVRPGSQAEPWSGLWQPLYAHLSICHRNQIDDIYDLVSGGVDDAIKAPPLQSYLADRVGCSSTVCSHF